MVKWFQIKSALLGGLMVFQGLNLAYADSQNTEILPLFPVVNLMPAPEMPAAEHNLFTQKFSHALAHSFLDLGVKLYDGTKIPALTQTGQIKNNADQNHSYMQLELELLADKNNQYLPYLKAVNLNNGEVLGMATTLPVGLEAGQADFSAATISLSRSLARKLSDKGHGLRGYGALFLASSPQNIRIAIEQFDSCEQNHILDVMEKEFPGFVSLELEKSPTPTISIFTYQTAASSQKIQKWLRVMLFEYGLASGDDFMIVGKADNLRLVARNKTPFLSNCF